MHSLLYIWLMPTIPPAAAPVDLHPGAVPLLPTLPGAADDAGPAPRRGSMAAATLPALLPVVPELVLPVHVSGWAEPERFALRRWTAGWLSAAEPRRVVVIGCSAGLARAMRGKRLRGLARLLAAAGVPPDRIRATEEVLPLPPGVTAEGHPLGVFRLQAVPLAAPDRPAPRALRACFDRPGPVRSA